MEILYKNKQKLKFKNKFFYISWILSNFLIYYLLVCLCYIVLEEYYFAFLGKMSENVKFSKFNFNVYLFLLLFGYHWFLNLDLIFLSNDVKILMILCTFLVKTIQKLNRQTTFLIFSLFRKIFYLFFNF